MKNPLIFRKTNSKELELELFEYGDCICQGGILNGIGSNSKADNESLYKVTDFLLHLYALSKEEKYLNRANLFIDKAYSNYILFPKNMTFLTGGAGIIYSLMRFFEETTDEKYLTKALDLAFNGSPYFIGSEQIGEGLFEGKSGLLLNILYLYDFTKNLELLRIIDKLIREILSTAIAVKQGLAWFTPFEMVIQPNCSFGYGVSGIGYVFHILGKYFGCSSFYEISNGCFNYVNGLCFNEDLSSWYDNRKDILCDTDLEEHIKEFTENNESFFKESPMVDSSIANGTAGIWYSQIENEQLLEKINPWPVDTKKCSKEDIIGLAHINVELFHKFGLRNNYSKAESLSLKLNNTTLNEIDYLDIAMLKMSLLKGKSCTFYFKKFKFQEADKGILPDFFQTPEDVFESLAKSNFGRTTFILSKIGALDNYDFTEVSCIDPEGFIRMKISNLKEELNKQVILEEVFKYEMELNHAKWERKHNPYWHAKHLVSLRERIVSMQIPIAELELKKVSIVSKHLKNTYIPIQKHIKGGQAIVPSQTFWRFDLENGISEMNLNSINFLLELFVRPKSIKTALYEIQHYISAQSERELKSLILYSESKNKSDLLERLPFILTYQVKILIADGVLEFYEK
ncbi:MAG: hypothetical protein CBB72_012025 [Muricauda sp. TMED12]|nr:MAG: hypothetical protein CBB72_012025 [Muricauda sp. TMED12]